MQLCIWRNFRLRIPRDWEMLQFSRQAPAGRCAFADRYQFRLELNWRAVDGKPDFDRMMSDYVARLLEQGAQSPGRLKWGAWHGVEAVLDEQIATRFGRYFPRESCLIELVFLWPEGMDQDLERRILDSTGEEAEYDGGFRRWRAFGIDLLASTGLALRECRVEPANAEMVFADETARTEERFGRRGMVSEWLGKNAGGGAAVAPASVRDWLRQRTPGDVLPGATGAFTRKGHEVEETVTEQRAPGLRGRIGRRIRRETAAWICPQDGRLYSVSLASPADGRRSPRAGHVSEAHLRLAGARLSCCEALELGT